MFRRVECEQQSKRRMENNTEPTSEAPVTTGAENTNASLTIQDLANSFIGKVEEQPEDQSTIDSIEESDQEVVDSEEDQDGNFFSQTDKETEKDSDEESDDSYFFRVSKIGRLWAFPE